MTGLPLGVINVAIVEAATAGRRTRARGIGLGGALADGVHAALAWFGVGALVVAEPALARGLAVIAAIAIASFAIATWRRAEVPVARVADGDGLARAFAIGVGLTLPNIGALGAWVAVAATWPAADPLARATAAVGVATGSAAWFVTLATLAGRVRRDDPRFAPWRRRLPRLAAVLLVAFGVAGAIAAFS